MSHNPQSKQIDGFLAFREGAINGLQLDWQSVDVVDIGPGACAGQNNALVIQNTATLSPDLSTTGANGLDTGVRTIDTWYFLHICEGSSGVAGLWSTSRTSPTLPTGYDNDFRMLGAFYNEDDGFSGELRQITRVEGIGLQRWFFLGEPETQGNWFDQQANQFGATWGAWEDIDLSIWVPPTCRRVEAVIQVFGWWRGCICRLRQKGSTATLGEIAAQFSGRRGAAPITFSVDASQVAQYNTEQAWYIRAYVTGYRMDLNVF